MNPTTSEPRGSGARLGLCSLWGLVAMFWGASGLHADTVYLHNGSSIDGTRIGVHEGFLILQIGNLGTLRIPEKQVLSVEKNSRTGYVDATKGKKKDVPKVPTAEALETGIRSPEPGSEGEAQISLDGELEKQVKSWVYDLTRQRTTVRVRAERRLIAIGSPVISYVLPIAAHPNERTRIAVFRIFKAVGDHTVVEPCLGALSDDNRFVRKLAWEKLKAVSGRGFYFPWDDTASIRDRETSIGRWQKWWEKEKEKIAAEEEAKQAADENAPPK